MHIEMCPRKRQVICTFLCLTCFSQKSKLIHAIAFCLYSQQTTIRLSRPSCNRTAISMTSLNGFRYVEAEHREGWAPEYFDGWRPTSNKRHLVLFKLHGSADWIVINSRIRRAEARHVVDGEEHWTNCLIYPARRKVALEDPHFTCYDYLTRCLEATRVCLTIGYSFRDYDALMRLHAAMAANDKLRLLLLSPKATDVLKGDEYLAGRWSPIDAPFGAPTGIASGSYRARPVVNYLSLVADHIDAALRSSADAAPT